MHAITADDDRLTLELSQRLIRTNTVDPPGNELPAAIIVRDFLADYGIESRLIEIGSNRAALIARIRGNSRSGALIYSAHLDTIPVDEDEWSVPPFDGRVIDDKLYGRGATDMKAALASMTVAAIAIKRSQIPLDSDLVLAYTAAENTDCAGAHAILQSGELDEASALLISEPTSMDIFVAEKGALWLRAIASGEPGHNAFSEDRDGDRGNAILRMADFLVQLQTLNFVAPQHNLLGPPTLNVGQIEGGVSFPIIPHRCSATIDIRTVPGMDEDAIVRQINQIAGPHISIDFVESKPPVETDPDHPFVRLCQSVSSDTGDRFPALAGVPYYTDGAIFAPALGIPMAILGPGEVGLSGTVDEFVRLSSLYASTRIFAEIAARYLSASKIQ